MERSSHAQRALALLHKQGFLRTSDLDTIGAPRVVLVTARHVLDVMPGNEARIGWRTAEADGA